MGDRRIRVAVAEDDRRYREGLQTLLGLASGIDLLSAWPTADELLAVVRDDPATGAAMDVVLMDIDMPGTSGIDATRRLKELVPTVRVVMLTVFEEPATILDAICAGADGYLLKKSSGADLLEQIGLVHEGAASLTPGVARTVLDLVRGERPRKVARPQRLDLTTREQEVLRGLVDGESYKEVAAELGISVDTVRTHIRSLYKKLHVQSATAAVSRAVREGLV